VVTRTGTPLILAVQRASESWIHLPIAAHPSGAVDPAAIVVGVRTRLCIVCALVTITACAKEAPPETLDATTTSSESSAGHVGELFQDPQSTYTMEIDPSWTKAPGTLVEEIEVWKVGRSVDGFTPNVNVLTQQAPNLDLEEYVELSRDSADGAGFDLVEVTIVEGANGQPLGVMEYTGRQGAHELHWLGVFALKDDRAVVATLTAPPDTFDELVIDVRPLLLTLENM
jgi:hypothetical protein